MFGLPKEVTLMATPDGWRHSLLTVDDGIVCGGAPHGLTAAAGPDAARAAATAWVVGAARDLHGVEVEVVWDTTWDPDFSSGTVVPAAGAEAPATAPGGERRRRPAPGG
ncbi:hypothetical protein SUDANB120_00173 [Streptomyces sp. enrichment culture]|nr:hypothetical protein GCM10010286_30130 [Streptomyces toxytricini]